MLACQEQLLPGARPDPEKYALAAALGYDGIELRGQGDLALRPPAARAAPGPRRRGGHADRLRRDAALHRRLRRRPRRDAVAQPASQLSVIAELGGVGAMTPASYGMFSRRLPPFEPPRSAGAGPPGAARRPRRARRARPRRGGRPLPGAAQPVRGPHGQPARRGGRALRGGRAGLGADGHRHLPHEHRGGRLTAAADRAAAPYIGHVQVSDSNRLQPGAGHLDWPALAAHPAGARTTRAGWPLECRLRGDPAGPCNRPPPCCDTPARGGPPRDAPARRPTAVARPRRRPAVARRRRRAAPTRGRHPRRQLGARPHGALAHALPAPVELGLGVHRHRAAPTSAPTAPGGSWRRLFGAQWADGRVPHIVFNPALRVGAYFPGPGVLALGAAGAGRARRGHLRHRPAAGARARRLAGVPADPAEPAGLAALRRLYPRLVAQQRYLADRRDVAAAGWPASCTRGSPGWTTARPGTRRWPRSPADAAVMRAYRRHDIAHADAAHRPTDLDYARYVRARRRPTATAATRRRPGRRHPFLVECPLFNAAARRRRARPRRDRRARSAPTPAPHRARAAADHRRARRPAVRPGHRHFHAPRPARPAASCRARTVLGLTPLILPDLPPRHASTRWSSRPRSAALRAGRRMDRPLPSYDRTAPDFEPLRYWRGPSWLNIGWLVRRGAARARPTRTWPPGCAAR